MKIVQCCLHADNSDNFPLKDTAENVPVISCFIAPLKTQPVPATPVAVSRRASFSCSFCHAVLRQSWEPKKEKEASTETSMITDNTDPTPNEDQSTDSSQLRMIIDTILIQIELSNKDSVVIDARRLLPSNKGNHARPNTVPSAVGWLSGVFEGSWSDTNSVGSIHLAQLMLN